MDGLTGSMIKPMNPAMAEKTGWIMAGLTESQNNTNWLVAEGNCAGAIFDIQQRLNIDTTHVYFSGFSGGSGRASRRSLAFPDMTAGLICIGAGFAQRGERPRQAQYFIPPAGLPIFFIVGQTDMNHEEVTKRVHPMEVQRKRPVELVIYPGGYTWGRPEGHEAAIRWYRRITNAAPVTAVRRCNGQPGQRGKWDHVSSFLGIHEVFEVHPTTRRRLTSRSDRDEISPLCSVRERDH